MSHGLTWKDGLPVTKSRDARREGLGHSRTVSGSAMRHVDDGQRSAGVVDTVDDAVGATACAAPIVQGQAELCADPVGVVEQRGDDEFVRGCGDRFG
jgi:hypothetical protein